MKLSRATKSIKKTDIEKEWFLVDAKDKILGRLCTNIAKILRGKHKPTFTPNTDTGDFVVVINAKDIQVTGRKATSKSYQRYSGYPSGLKEEKYLQLLATKPERIITNAVKGMLPHNKLGRAMIKKLKVYAGPEHPHEAQNPKLTVITKE